MSKSAIKKAIKVIDKQIDTETGGDGEALDNETLQALEQERERLLAMNEKREDVGKYNTVKKVIKELGRRPSEQELATFINNNYYDVTEVERGEDDPAANDKIADLVGFYKFDIDDWEIAWFDAQNESVVNEEKIKYAKGKTYQSSGHWTVMVDSNSSMCDIRVNHSAGWRLDPHDDREETWELLDNGRQRATIYFRSGNIDKFAKQMFDLNDRTTWGNKTKLTVTTGDKLTYKGVAYEVVAPYGEYSKDYSGSWKNVRDKFDDTHGRCLMKYLL